MTYQETSLVKKQQEMGHQVLVITSDRYSTGLKQLYKTKKERIVGYGEFIEGNIKVVRLPTLMEIGSRVFCLRLKKTLSDFSPEVVHCHDIFSFFFPFLTSLYKKVLGYHLIFDSHAADFNTDARSNWLRRLSYALYRSTARNLIKQRADVIVAIGENEQSFICREFGLTNNEVKIIRLGADKDIFQFDVNSRKNIRRYFGIQENELLIIHTGKLSPDKDVEVLIKAFIKVAEQFHQIKLLIIGAGELNYVNYLKLIANEGGFSHRIIFHPFVKMSELPGYYSAADLSVWPGNPTISIFEAMSVGLPIIVCDDPYHIATLTNGNAFFFKRGSVDALANFLVYSIPNDNLRKIMGEKSRELIEKKFNWDTIASQFIKMYEGITCRDL